MIRHPICGYLSGDDLNFEIAGGMTAPTHPKYYAKANVTTNYVADFPGGEPGYGFDDYTQHDEREDVWNYTRSADDAGDCGEVVIHTATYSGGYSGTYDVTPDGDYLVSYEYSGVKLAGDAIGSGTETYTYAISGADVRTISEVESAPSGYVSSSWTGATWTGIYENGTIVVEYLGIKQQPYQFGVPVDYERSTWEMEWDEVAGTEIWFAWYDAGMIGTEPTPPPYLHEHKSWVWDGDFENKLSPVYDPYSEEEGIIIRPVNVLTTCWRSTRLGSKPTATGPEVALPE